MKLLVHDMKRVYQWINLQIDLELSERGVDISTPQAFVLVGLLRGDSWAPSQKVIADYVSIDTNTLHGITQRLAKRGLVVRGTPKQSDNTTAFPRAGYPFGRETPLSLTESGKGVAETAQQALERVDALVREKLGCFAAGFEDGLDELVDVVKGRPQVE